MVPTHTEVSTPRRRRYVLVALGATLVAWPLAAQQPAKVYRIGFLALGIGPGTRIAEAFREGLRELGYIEGQNAVLDYRFADGQANRLAGLATELVHRGADVIVVESYPAALAAKQATSSIPIITAVISDPVSSGLVADLARPGGNITGLTNIPSKLMGKRLELLKSAAPNTAVVGVIWNSSNPAARGYLENTVAAANSLGLRLVDVQARQPGDLDVAFSAVIRGRAEALATLPDGMIWNNRKAVVEFALRSRLPSVFDARDFAESGGLLVYGPSLAAMFRRSAAYVDKILKGANPGSLPFELPTKFGLIINMKTAKALGLTIPPSFLFRADEVIE